MPEVGQEVALDGIVVAEGTHAVFVDAMLQVAGAPDQRLRDHRARFVLLTASGAEITVTFDERACVRPERETTGPWREIKQHPAHPTGAFPPDGRVRLSGAWLVPGEQVHVIGRVTAHEFVPDTGGEREPPEQRVSGLEAIAIGIGDDATAQATTAAARYLENARPALTPRAAVRRRRLVGATCLLAIASLVLLGLEIIAHTHTLGLGWTLGYCALLVLWWSSPELVPFPGGASDDDPVTPGPIVAITCGLVLACGLILVVVVSGVARIAGGCAGLVLLGLVPPIQLVGAVVAKPRSEPGGQVMLPAGALRRWTIVIGTVGVVLASLVTTIAVVAAGQ